MTENVAIKTERPEQKLDPVEYNRLVAHAKVQTIRLINSRYDMKPAALAGDREDWVYNVSNRLLDWHCDCDALVLSGTWEYTATCVGKRRKLLTVTCKYLVAYRLSAPCDAEAGREFLERVGRFAAYPYFRSTFAMLTQQSGILLHPLPIISEQPRWVTPPEASSAPLGSSGSRSNPTKRAKTKPTQKRAPDSQS